MPDLSATSLFQEGAASIRERITRGAVTPGQVLAAASQQIRLLEDKVQAWNFLDLESAHREARLLAAEAAAGRVKPLHGIPVGIKDEFLVKGMPTAMRDTPDLPLEEEDATCVARLRAAGALILGKTHMTVAGRRPPTRNPWNLEHTPGGTSGGSAAAVAARMVPLALGVQTMGSNLRPAAYCGVVGLKPSYGRVSRFGCLPFAWSMDHVGIMTLNVADAALVLSVISGADPRDSTTLQEPPLQIDPAGAAPSPPRIGIVRNFFWERLGEATTQDYSNAIAIIAKSGAQLSQITLPGEFALSWPAARMINAAEGSTYHSRAHLERNLPGSAGRAGSLIPASYYLEARRIRAWLLSLLQVTFQSVDILIMPAIIGPAPKGMNTGDAGLLIPWSFLGLPAISLPIAGTENDLPLGIQMVAGPSQDRLLLASAAWCESVLPRLGLPYLLRDSV